MERQAPARKQSAIFQTRNSPSTNTVAGTRAGLGNRPAARLRFLTQNLAGGQKKPSRSRSNAQTKPITGGVVLHYALRLRPRREPLQGPVLRGATGASQGVRREPISFPLAAGMTELRLCVDYVLAHGGKHLVRSAWLPDSPRTRSLLDEMATNAQAMDALVRWWIERREPESQKGEHGGRRLVAALPDGSSPSARPSGKPSTRPSARPSTRPSAPLWNPTKDVLR